MNIISPAFIAASSGLNYKKNRREAKLLRILQKPIALQHSCAAATVYGGKGGSRQSVGLLQPRARLHVHC